MLRFNFGIQTMESDFNLGDTIVAANQKLFDSHTRAIKIHVQGLRERSHGIARSDFFLA
jgi:hypothetical protein